MNTTYEKSNYIPACRNGIFHGLQQQPARRRAVHQTRADQPERLPRVRSRLCGCECQGHAHHRRRKRIVETRPRRQGRSGGQPRHPRRIQLGEIPQRPQSLLRTAARRVLLFRAGKASSSKPERNTPTFRSVSISTRSTRTRISFFRSRSSRPRNTGSESRNTVRS